MRRPSRWRGLPFRACAAAASSHEARIEAQLHVLGVAEHRLVGEFDADHVGALGVLAEQALANRNSRTRSIVFGDVLALGEGGGLRRRGEQLRGRELRFESGEIGARSLGHRLARGLALRVIGMHQRQRLVPDADQRLAEVGLSLSVCGVDHHQVHDFAGDLAMNRTRCARPGDLQDLQDDRIPGHDRGDVGRRRRRPCRRRRC